MVDDAYICLLVATASTGMQATATRQRAHMLQLLEAGSCSLMPGQRYPQVWMSQMQCL